MGYTDELMDTTGSTAGQPRGLYSGNVGGGAGPVTFGYTQVGNTYIDVWSTIGVSLTNPFRETQHYIVTANDTGFHGYYVIGHGASDPAGTLGQQQYIYRVNPARCHQHDRLQRSESDARQGPERHAEAGRHGRRLEVG